jgi:hypothetical protein
VIPTTVIPQCPGDHWSAWQVTFNTGAVLTTTLREQPDLQDNFAFPLAFNPWAPGDHLVCAYTDDGQTHTITGTAMLLNVQPAASSPPPAAAPPVNTSKPRLKRSGRKLVCRTGTWSNTRPATHTSGSSTAGRATAAGRSVSRGACAAVASGAA